MTKNNQTLKNINMSTDTVLFWLLKLFTNQFWRKYLTNSIKPLHQSDC